MVRGDISLEHFLGQGKGVSFWDEERVFVRFNPFCSSIINNCQEYNIRLGQLLPFGPGPYMCIQSKLFQNHACEVGRSGGVQLIKLVEQNGGRPISMCDNIILSRAILDGD